MTTATTVSPTVEANHHRVVRVLIAVVAMAAIITAIVVAANVDSGSPAREDPVAKDVPSAVLPHSPGAEVPAASGGLSPEVISGYQRSDTQGDPSRTYPDDWAQSHR